MQCRDFPRAARSASSSSVRMIRMRAGTFSLCIYCTRGIFSGIWRRLGEVFGFANRFWNWWNIVGAFRIYRVLQVFFKIDLGQRRKLLIGES